MSAGGLDSTLTPLEVATGLTFGGQTRVKAKPGEPEPPLEALRRAIVPSLAHPPCLVSFSGGRDSSCVLAAAVHFAHREGLPLPIPATNRFPRAGATDESAWQELVIGRLDLDDWVRLELGDELDAVGPHATRALRRHGLLWPFNAHFHAPLLEAARGGSLLTGIGGDEVFGRSSWARVNDVLRRRVRPELRDVLRVSAAFSPRPLRRRAVARTAPVPFPWLRPAARRELALAWGDHVATEPRGYAARLEWWRARRSVRLNFRSMELLARDAESSIAHPLVDADFGASLAQLAPRDGPIDRGRLMAGAFGDLLPREVYDRRSKASFDEAFWGRYARKLASRWNGEAADPELVDVEALRENWASPTPDSHGFTLLQAAWLELGVKRPVQADTRPQVGADPSRAVAGAPMPAAPRA